MNFNSITKCGRYGNKGLLKDDHIEKLNDIKDNVFLQPTVITVKKDRSEKIALDARSLNQYLLVSVDNSSGWPDAMFLPNTSADRVVEFLVEYIAKHGLPKK